ncbi:hypothetical protein CCZ01_02310 [Helicobacter monodelphidis]|uniref:flagellar filament capping protein FliD n=1 Tax=Helicobacter sp. 15-1451 TaxID=2004995 RepID=UPI000DCDF90D|nr:flagellar filament capping protein FliD [Helicobacter sp. 15-1451]RAX58636.1 hypothetical protein CCZ01_02310 [Helicobacter sp. 15-1451]
MAGTINALGIGSGILTGELLDQLKDAEINGIIKPYTEKMQTNLSKQTALTEIVTLLNTFGSSFKSYLDTDAYLKRTATVTGEGVTANIGSGVAEQDIKIETHQLAKGDVTQVGRKFESRDSVFSSVGGNMKFVHDGQEYNVNIKPGQTVGEVAQAITDATDGKVMGIMMKTGGAQPYQLMIQSKDTGEANRVYFGTSTTSDIVKGGAIKGSFDLTVKDANGQDKKLTINLDTPSNNSSQDNAAAVQKAVQDAFSSDPDLKSLYDDGTLSIGLTGDGKKFTLNDSRGSKISLENTDPNVDTLKDIGLKAGEFGSGSVFESQTTVRAGTVGGKITLGATGAGNSTLTIDLDAVVNQSYTDPNTGTVYAAGSREANLYNTINYINNNSNGELIASEKNGRLVIDTKDGSDLQVTFDQGNTGNQNNAIQNILGISAGKHSSNESFLKDTLQLSKIQTAQDSKFSWNGMEVSRPTNTIDDVVSGISVELTKEHSADESSMIRIKSDTTDIFDKMEEFVESYNALMSKLEELTKYDPDTKIGGLFQGDSAIRDIKSSLANIISYTAGSDGSLLKYGIEVNSDGKLTLDKATLQKKYKEDPEAAMAFFKGGEALIGGTEIMTGRDEEGNPVYKRVGGHKVEIEGIFTQFDKLVKGLFDEKNSFSTLKAYEQSLKSDYDRLDTNKKADEERINNRYESMQEKWSKYDAMISKYQMQGQQISTMIGAMSGNQ